MGGLKRWKVLRTNHGYLGRYFTEGEVVWLDEEATPPHHFQPLEEWEQSEPGKNALRKDPMKPTPYLPGKYPLTSKREGFSSALPPIVPPEAPVTAGKAAKDKK